MQTDNKTIQLKEIARLLDGELNGDGDIVISSIRPIDAAKEGDITFAVSSNYKTALENSKAAAAIIPDNWPDPDSLNMAFIKVRNPYLAYAKISNYFNTIERTYIGISNQATCGKNCIIEHNISIYPNVVIGDNVQISKHTIIYPGAVIGNNVTIGANTTIYPNVVIYDNTVIGSNVIIHAGVIIGADGFGYAQDHTGHVKIPHTGRVVIEDDVEIGANTTIDRAVFDQTVIQQGTKIDNLVQIGHNCNIGAYSIIVAQVAIGGSAKIGNRVMIGGQAAIKDHVTIGDDAKIVAQSGVAQDVPAGQVLSGSPAIPHRQWLKVSMLLKKLPELFKQVREISSRISKLEDL